ncbi:hypothetical protein ATCC90586_012067 [Pythium insidiosum]|nr:hypothetical protein ATCC90586_012067 [Pythium insidiosum]
MVNAHIMSSAVGAPPVGSSTALIGVETICVVDVRDQSPDPLESSHLLDALDAAHEGKLGTAANPSASGAPASAFKLKIKEGGSGSGFASSAAQGSVEKESGRLFSRVRPISAATLKKQREKLQKKRLDEVKRNARKEAEWHGRAGGMDLAPSTSASPAPATGKKLPPISGGVSRTNSAPVLKKADEDAATEDSGG